LVLETYARADAGHRSTIADLFVEDGRQTLGVDTVVGRETIRQVLAARDIPGRRTQHVVTDFRFAPTTGDQWCVRYTLTLYVLSDPDGQQCIPRSLSSVEDVLVRDGGQWLLRSRELQFLAGSV
jgi:hypothetical protein